MYNEVVEGKAKINVKLSKKTSKEMEVFYNPVMKFNRDVSVLLLNSIGRDNLQIALPLAGTGVRGLRFLLELKKEKIKKIDFNDLNKKAADLIKKNLKLNKIKNKNVEISNQDANVFLLNSAGYDYIDIDPWGNPSPFLDAAVKRLARRGILAVTATDTSALCGTYPKVCLRKYWALPKKDYMMHETGLRILIRKIQLVGAQYEKALLPVFSYSKEHYMRVFLICDKSRREADKIIEEHGTFNNAGPMWLGQLWDRALAGKINKNNTIKENNKFLNIIKTESKINTVGFYHIHKICKKYKKKIPKKQDLIKEIRKKGYKAEETHFSPEAIRSDISLKKLAALIK